MSKRNLPNMTKGKTKLTKKHLGIMAIALAVLVLTIWLSDVLYGESDNPVDWAREMPRESILSVELSFPEVEGYLYGLNVTMTDEMVDELYDIIHSMKRNNFVRGSVSDYDAGIYIRCHNTEIVLTYKDGVAGLLFDDVAGAEYGGNRDWKIESDELKEFIEKYKASYFEELGIEE